MDALQATSSVLETVDVAHRAATRLKYMLEDWSAAPSVMPRLQEITTRLHDLLVRIVHTQTNVVNTTSPRHTTGALVLDIASTRSTLSWLEDVLEGSQAVAAGALGQNVTAQQSSVRSRARWVQRSTLAELQRKLEDCYQRLLIRLMELNVLVLIVAVSDTGHLLKYNFPKHNRSQHLCHSFARVSRCYKLSRLNPGAS